MDVYTLDSNFYRSQIIDSYESFIWTERYSAWGDFEIVFSAEAASRHRFNLGWYIGIDRSNRVMVVENIEMTNRGGERKLIVSGRSFESVLEDRLPIWYFNDDTTFPIADAANPSAIVEQMFRHTFLPESLVEGDHGYEIRDYVPGFALRTPEHQPGMLPMPDTQIVSYAEFETVYDYMKRICEEWALGFRLVRASEVPKEIFFECYIGSDRTMHQTVLPPIVFSRGLDTLTDTTDLITNANRKTVAVVYARRDVDPIITAQHQIVQVYSNGATSKSTGLARRTLLVDATDLDPKALSRTQMLARMRQRGMAALRQHRTVRAFDGEVPQDSPYIYGKDYNLGDLVSLYDDAGLERSAMVTEQIFVSDQEGVREYPTLG